MIGKSDPNVMFKRENHDYILLFNMLSFLRSALCRKCVVINAKKRYKIIKQIKNKEIIYVNR